MISGASWQISISDCLIILALVLLFVEIVRASASMKTTTLVNHALSVIVMMLGAILFIIASAFSNSTFFIIVVMTVIDVVAGFTISIVSARRDFGISPQSAHEHAD